MLGRTSTGFIRHSVLDTDFNIVRVITTFLSGLLV